MTTPTIPPFWQIPDKGERYTNLIQVWSRGPRSWSWGCRYCLRNPARKVQCWPVQHGYTTQAQALIRSEAHCREWHDTLWQTLIKERAARAELRELLRGRTIWKDPLHHSRVILSGDVLHPDLRPLRNAAPDLRVARMRTAPPSATAWR